MTDTASKIAGFHHSFYSAVWCKLGHTVECSVYIVYIEVQGIGAQYSTVQCSTEHYTTVHCTTVYYSTLQHTTLKYSKVQ